MLDYERGERDGGELPLHGDLIRRFAPPSPCAGKALANPNQHASRQRRDKALDYKHGERDGLPHQCCGTGSQ